MLHVHIYKDYVNLCDIRVGSYVTLGTKDAQNLLYIYYAIGMIHAKYLCIWSMSSSEYF